MNNTDKHTLRVHISECPSERYLHLDRVREHLEAIEDVSVSVTPVPTEGADDLPLDTDVLIILATERYFTAKGSGYSSEYLRAKERGISVLPLLFDNGIVNLLNTRCGKTQYILATDGLNSALTRLTDKLLFRTSSRPEKPRVFISYRKRDIEHLRALLDVIADMECAHTLPVWYDADILPGDNYEREIDTAINACDLFILLVTPSLLEENNFAMRHEYPLARSLNKRILPIEAVKTDRRTLCARYPNLPAPVSMRQIGAIKAELEKLI